MQKASKWDLFLQCLVIAFIRSGHNVLQIKRNDICNLKYQVHRSEGTVWFSKNKSGGGNSVVRGGRQNEKEEREISQDNIQEVQVAQDTQHNKRGNSSLLFVCCFSKGTVNKDVEWYVVYFVYIYMS